MDKEKLNPLDKGIQALNFKVIEQIKKVEDKLLNDILSNHLGRAAKGKDLKFIGKQFDLVRKNLYFLYFKEELLGTIEYIKKSDKFGLSFNPMI